LEARHRAHARVEDRIKAAKDTGLGRFPSREYAINQAWLQLVAVAADLTAWLRLLALTGDLAVVEPKLLRLTGLADLRRWPSGMRVIIRRERPHPGAQLSLLEEADGWGYLRRKSTNHPCLRTS
jgi:hypothetical protein